MQKRMKLLKNQKGMTLVELLAVLVILGIIAAIAVPMIGNIINDSKDKAILADAQTILSGAKVAQANGEGEKNDKKGTITFNSAVLQNYVDGVTLEDTDSVIYNLPAENATEGTWSVTYSKLGDIKKANRTKYGITKARGKYTITASDLSKALKGEVPTPTTQEKKE